MHDSTQHHAKSVVVGGGLAGIVASILLAQAGRRVALIESLPQLGGLLRSHHNEQGVPFDCGTHIPKQIGIEGLDELLFVDLDDADWQQLDRLRVGGYQQNTMYPTSQFIDLRLLPEAQRNAAVYEILNKTPIETVEGMTAHDYAMAMFGPTVTQSIIQPLMQKLYGLAAEQLQPSALGLVGYSRFIGFDRQASHEIKKSPLLDAKFGFNTWDDGLSSLMNYYPRSQGIHIWLDRLLERAKRLGVEILTAAKIVSVDTSQGSVCSVQLEGRTIETDELFWTASPAVLLKLMGKPMPQGVSPPKFRSTALLHLIFDRDFLSDLYFYYCHEPSMLSFRTTLYSNMRSEARGKAPFNCTIEVMADEDTVNAPDLPDKLLAEMKQMGVIGGQHKVLYQKVVASPRGFPLPTVGFGDNARKLAACCEEAADNIELLGRATGKTHFMHEVLAEVWQKLGNEAAAHAAG